MKHNLPFSNLVISHSKFLSKKTINFSKLQNVLQLIYLKAFLVKLLLVVIVYIRTPAPLILPKIIGINVMEPVITPVVVKN